MKISPEEIAERFDISLAAAKIRARELARIQRGNSGELRQVPQGILEFLRNQKKKGLIVRKVDLDNLR